MKVILLGPPGAGKGTQATRITEFLRVPKVSSGDLFRNHKEMDTQLGRVAKSYMERGILVPDEITTRMVMEWVDANEKVGGFLLDGFPRTLGQAQALDQEFQGRPGIDRTLYINVSERELVRRLTGRLICSKCQTPYHKKFSPPERQNECDKCEGVLYERDDDRPETVMNRIKVYFSETEPLVEYYREAGTLKEVNGEQSITNVGLALEKSLSS